VGMSIGHEGVALVAVRHVAMAVCPSPVGASWIGRWPRGSAVGPTAVKLSGAAFRKDVRRTRGRGPRCGALGSAAVVCEPMGASAGLEGQRPSIDTDPRGGVRWIQDRSLWGRP
jgi:hypothetical protein